MEKLLLVAPEKQDFDRHINHLRSEGFALSHEENESNIIDRVAKEGFCGIIFWHKNDYQQCIPVCSDVKEKTQLPVFMISEHKNESSAVDAIKRGIFHLPHDSTPLYTSSIIRMYIDDRAQNKVEEDLVVDAAKKACDIELKESTKQLFIRGKNVKCSAKTYDLWRYLLLKGSEYTSTEEIYEEVWHEEILQGYKDTIRVHIKKIRDCIPQNMKDICFVENSRGKGYRFVGSFRAIKCLFFI